MKSICLITPPSPFLLDERVFAALGILKVGAVLEQAGWKVEHLDFNGVADYLIVLGSYLEDTDVRVFAITSTTPQFPQAVKISRTIHDHFPMAWVVIGGPHPTLVNAAAKTTGASRAHQAKWVLIREFDSIVCGDGEDAVFKAVEERQHFVDADDVKSKLFLTTQKLEELPLPARHLIDLKSYKYEMDGVETTSLISQLGCPMSCFFCAGRSSPMLRRMRLRSTESVMLELEHLYREYGYRGFMFLDDELNINKEFLNMLRAMGELQSRLGVAFKCRGFIKAELFTEDQAAEMRRNGFKRVLCGFESGSERILKNIHKNATRDENTKVMELAEKYGLEVKALMSIGHPGETEETVRATMDWVREVRPKDFDITIITPYPGSPYYDRAELKAGGDYVFTVPENGDQLFMKDVDYSLEADYYKGAPGEYVSHVWTEGLTREELVKVRDQADRELRDGLKIPWNKAAGKQFEASMGQTPGR